MAKFVEIVSVHGNRRLINLDHVRTIERKNQMKQLHVETWVLCDKDGAEIVEARRDTMRVTDWLDMTMEVIPAAPRAFAYVISVVSVRQRRPTADDVDVKMPIIIGWRPISGKHDQQWTYGPIFPSHHAGTIYLPDGDGRLREYPGGGMAADLDDAKHRVLTSAQMEWDQTHAVRTAEVI